jgi:NADPH:quinone reductase-like Zn-dependent oxidoreductase
MRQKLHSRSAGAAIPAGQGIQTRRRRTTATMRAAVCVRPGGPGALEVRELPVPAVREGWSLVQVMGAGLNRSELRTRQGYSPSVTFPRVLGIECVGTVAVSTDPTLPEGTTVAAIMGEMGRAFDGSYAQYALLPNLLLTPIRTTLPWDVLAALPETYLTAQGSLDALGIAAGGRLLIRGGTSSVGMAAASIASGHGVETAATTRQQGKAGALAAAGADYALVDEAGSLAESVQAIWPEGPDYVLDLVGASTAIDSLRIVRAGGTVCVSGSLSGWAIADFEPIAMIPSGTRLTAFHSDSLKGSAGATVLQRVIHEVQAGVYWPNVDRVFALDDIAAAHQHMESNRATGKLVVLPWPASAVHGGGS